MNNWKLATIILYPTQKNIKIGTIELPKKTFDNMINVFENETFRICNLKNSECIYIKLMP